MSGADVGSLSAGTIKLKFRKHFDAAVPAGRVCTEVAEVLRKRARIPPGVFSETSSYRWPVSAASRYSRTA
jgi:hypothetical protein